MQAGGCCGAPRVSAPGLFEPDDPETDRVDAGVRRRAGRPAGARCGGTMRRWRDAARAALRRALGRRLQKRPLVDVHLLRV